MGCPGLRCCIGLLFKARQRRQPSRRRALRVGYLFERDLLALQQHRDRLAGARIVGRVAERSDLGKLVDGAAGDPHGLGRTEQFLAQTPDVGGGCRGTFERTLARAARAEVVADVFAEELTTYIAERQDVVYQERLAAALDRLSELEDDLNDKYDMCAQLMQPVIEEAGKERKEKKSIVFSWDQGGLVKAQQQGMARECITHRLVGGGW